MFTKTKETKTAKYALLTALIALAVLISLATAGKAKAAESEIESVKYEPAKQEVVCASEVVYNHVESALSNIFYVGDKQKAELSPYCALGTFDNLSLDDCTLDSFKDPKLYENHFIATNDKLTITRKDGSVQTLTPYYKSLRNDEFRSYGAQEEWNDFIVWVDMSTNKATDIDTYFSWSDVPEAYTDRYLYKEKYKQGTYDNTVTVEVGDKSTDYFVRAKSATFKKKIIVKGSSVSSYDKKVPVVNNKKIKTGYKKIHKDMIVDGFWIKWPKYKDAYLYSVRLKMIYPKTLANSNYETKILVANHKSNILHAASAKLKDTDLNDDLKGWRYLTTDTMMELSVRNVKESNPEKTGSDYVYGKNSKPVRIFLSKNKTLKAKGKKRSVKLTWNKVYRASGYKIKYSTKKNMSKAKTIKVKGGNKKAYTIKKLKKNKKYYFQITPYKVYKGKTYTGYASAKKAAKAK